jgi:anaerobic magnesium-protoporphyrin IX monomethyl ester cyclase
MVPRVDSEDKKPVVALVNLRARSNDWHHLMMVPLGTMYVSAALREALGDRIEIRGFDVCTCPQYEDADHLVRAFLEETKPDIVGIRGFTSQAEEFPVVAEMAKKANPDCITIAGGPHACTKPPSLIKEPLLDFVCFGEGEETMVEFVRNILDGRDQAETAGIGWSVGDEVHLNPGRPLIADIDKLPRPDYSIIDLDAYQGKLAMTDFLTQGRFSSIFTSRGCPYGCTYCHDNFGRKVRFRSAENVLDEIDYLMHEHGIVDFQIIDDIFNADKKRAITIFNEVVRRGWKIWFAFPNGLRGDIMDEEFIIAAREAGTYHWALAVETATPRIQKLIRKRNKLDKLFETIRLSDQHGVFVCTFNMLGFPTETEEEMQNTVKFNLDSSAHIAHFFVVTPFPGTPMFDGLVAEGMGLDPEKIGHGFQNFSVENPEPQISEVPRERIEELMVEVVGRFHFSAKRLRRMIALTAASHNHAQLALHLEQRRWAAGLDYDSIEDREGARLLAWLNRKAKTDDPALCGHLPDPPADLLKGVGDQPPS